MAFAAATPCKGGDEENLITSLIRSGDYKMLCDAMKGFRNGFVCGARIRAPHSLALNLVWSPAPPNVIARKVLAATRQHAMNLGKTGFVFSLMRSLLAKICGGRQPWHAAFAGLVVGTAFWGEQNAINIQMGLYILSRILSGLLMIMLRRMKVELPQSSFRLFSGLLWAIVMYMFFHESDALQSSMRVTMKYIYVDNEKYSSLYDLLCVNSATSF